MDAAGRRRAAEGSKNFLTSRELAEALGVSESSVKRWANEGRVTAVRTIGGHRRIPLDEALRFIREEGLCLARPEILGIGFAASGRKPRDEEAWAESRELHAALLDGDAEKVRQMLLGAFYSGRSIAELCDGPISYALREIGCLWQEDMDRGVYREHRAIEICFDTLHRLGTLLPSGEPGRPKAIGCAPNRDVYALPTSMASLVLQERGYAATNLGPVTPMSALERAVEDCRPRIAWIATHSEASENPPQDIVARAAAIARSMASWGGYFVVGGSHVPGELRMPEAPNMRYFESFGALASFAATLLTAV